MHGVGGKLDGTAGPGPAGTGRCGGVQQIQLVSVQAGATTRHPVPLLRRKEFGVKLCFFWVWAIFAELISEACACLSSYRDEAMALTWGARERRLMLIGTVDGLQQASGFWSAGRGKMREGQG